MKLTDMGSCCAMLKTFEFENSYSYLNKVKFDMSAELSADSFDSKGIPTPKDVELFEKVRGRTKNSEFGILPVAAIYGKNAGGKTNLLKALGDAAKDALGVSFTDATTQSPFNQIITNRHFKILDREKRKKLSWYNICIVLGANEYMLEYSIGVDGIVDEIVSKREICKNADVEVIYDRNDKAKGKDPVINKYLDLMVEREEKQLWFPLIAPAHNELKPFFEWFRCIRDGLTFNNTESNIQKNVFEKIAERIYDNADEPFRNELLNYLKCIDKSISDIEGRKGESDKCILWVFHKNADHKEKNKFKNWAHDIDSESAGTRKLIEQFPQIYKSLEEGIPFVCDELDRMLHPVVFRHLVKTFNCPKKNKNNAQLIFTAHDTIALDSDFLRRDEVHIIDKGDYSVSTIKRLSEMPEVLAYANMELDFRTGIYGSFPEGINNALRQAEGE